VIQVNRTFDMSAWCKTILKTDERIIGRRKIPNSHAISPSSVPD
jgi:hypothetical protein